MLEQESAFYKAHQAEYRKEYLHKWLILANGGLFGVYDTPIDAVNAAQEHFNDDEFILHQPADDYITLGAGPVEDPSEFCETGKPDADPLITSSNGELLIIPYA